MVDYGHAFSPLTCSVAWVQLEELEYNLWEHVLCRVVDYGHAFSPEIEMAALAHGDELLHGEAVNIDMALTTQVALAAYAVIYKI